MAIQEYEYLVVELTNYELSKTLNELGAEGWRVVDVSPYGRFILERPKPQPSLDRAFPFETSHHLSQP